MSKIQKYLEDKKNCTVKLEYKTLKNNLEEAKNQIKALTFNY